MAIIIKASSLGLNFLAKKYLPITWDKMFHNFITKDRNLRTFFKVNPEKDEMGTLLSRWAHKKIYVYAGLYHTKKITRIQMMKAYAASMKTVLPKAQAILKKYKENCYDETNT